MKIRYKQLIHFLILSIGFISTLIVVGFSFQWLRRIEREKTVLVNLSKQSYQTISNISYLMLSSSLEDLWAEVHKSKGSLEEAFTDIENITLLPKINNEIAEAMVSIINLKPLTLRYFSNLQLSERSIFKEKETLNIGDLSFTQNLSIEEYHLHRYIINELLTNYYLFYSSMDYITTEIDRQIQRIDNELERTIGLNAILLFSLTGMVLCVSFLLSFRFSSLLTNDIDSISRILSEMKDSSEPIYFRLERKDELGILAVNIETIFLELLKMRTHLEDLVQKRTKALSVEIHQRKSAEEDLTITLNSIGDGVIATNKLGQITRMNPLAEQLTGFQRKKALGEYIDEIFQLRDFFSGIKKENPIFDALKRGEKTLLEENVKIINSKGHEIHISESAAPIISEDHSIIGAVLVFRDITEIYKLKSQLEHTQKMDAIGKLAGGVAHDFNNMLGGIMNATELLYPHIEGNTEAENLHSLIIETIEKAASLTRQLLTFARKEFVVMTHFKIDPLIKDTIQLLGRTIDKRINIELDLNDSDCNLTGDPAMIENSLLNLAINSCHAMPEGGTLTISTARIFLDSDYCEQSTFDLDAGEFLQIRVDDTGIGISQKNLARIFEPFFTTKAKGKGTGMGLASVYGAISQHRGEILVTSQLNAGTQFRIFLPITEPH